MYKFVVITALIFFPSILLSAELFACRFHAAGGFEWEKDKWNLQRFNNTKSFSLKINDSGNIAMNSIEDGKVLQANNYWLNCQFAGSPKIGCASVHTGEFLIFNPNTMKGAVSSIYGATMKDDIKKDSIYVSYFSCEKQ
jgi:hypothetical protein